jgi:hypothetical protein
MIYSLVFHVGRLSMSVGRKMSLFAIDAIGSLRCLD